MGEGLTRPPRAPPTLVVGVGSFGEATDTQRLVGALPTSSGMAFILVRGGAPDGARDTELLRSHTRMPVVDVNGTLEILADHVYVVPEGHVASEIDRVRQRLWRIQRVDVPRQKVSQQIEQTGHEPAACQLQRQRRCPYFRARGGGQGRCWNAQRLRHVSHW